MCGGPAAATLGLLVGEQPVLTAGLSPCWVLQGRALRWVGVSVPPPAHLGSAAEWKESSWHSVLLLLPQPSNALRDGTFLEASFSAPTSFLEPQCDCAGIQDELDV